MSFFNLNLNYYLNSSCLQTNRWSRELCLYESKSKSKIKLFFQTNRWSRELRRLRTSWLPRTQCRGCRRWWQCCGRSDSANLKQKILSIKCKPGGLDKKHGIDNYQYSVYLRGGQNVKNQKIKGAEPRTSKVFFGWSEHQKSKRSEHQKSLCWKECWKSENVRLSTFWTFLTP